MKGRLILLLLMGMATAGIAQNSWKKEKVKMPFSVCYASNESYSTYVGPPREYYERLKSASILKADIEVTYVGFPAEAQQAFQYAVDIWKNLVFSPIPIRLKATWSSLAKGVLGSCGPSGYYKNFNSTEKWNCYYPIALVEKMTGEQVNTAGEYEMEANFNKDFSNWYFGTDGVTPPRQYDFVSVVLHELTHGLGFTGLFYSTNGKGAYNYGGDSLGGIFDQYVINQTGQKLVTKSLFPDPSVALNLQLTSGWLAFNTKLTGGALPRLYAPATWNEGSSMYHLDDATYPAGDTNSLMTPFTGMGEAIHSPGPATLAIMYEIGWRTTTIKHQPLKDIEVAAPIAFNATIESDYPLDSSKLYLVYSTNKFAKKDSLLLKKTAGVDNFTAQPAQFKSGEVDYFFSATDINQRRFVYPSNAPARYLHFKIGPDTEAPVVTHEPIKYLLSSHPSATIEAGVTDNLGVKSVRIDYFINGGVIQQIPMTNTAPDVYTGNLAFPAGTVKGGDKVSYRITATDASSQSNVGRSPLTGYYTFTIEKIQLAAEKYVNNFNATTNDFIGSDFNVSTPTGFDSPGLNSPHPYPSPDADNMHFDLTTTLRYPIVLKTGGKMKFDEIVLVEPGDSGAVFGDENFFDYVIVEGSKDGGNSWKPLMDGYDSRLHDSWYKLFTGSMSGNNSTAVPTKDLFVNHEIDMLSNRNFVAGDTILVRFRLYSDPYSHGWGWIIDNLNIQDFVSDSHTMAISSGEVTFYPNPASDRVTVRFQTKNVLGKIVLKVYNSSGVEVYNKQMEVGANTFQTDIDVSRFSHGLYLFSVEPEWGKVINRKILIR